MPGNTETPIEVSAFSWVPDFARGHVRDLRVRWALEEIGAPYRSRLLNAMEPRSEAYLAQQPFGQVPAFRDGEVQIFESGAILLHLGERDARLMPRDAQGRAGTMCWTFAALNSIEPIVGQLGDIDIFNPEEEWAKLRRPGVEEQVRGRLAQLSEALGDRQWLLERFTVADIAMVTVLRDLGHTTLVAEQPNLAAYLARGTARPAFQRAYNAQLADFVERDAA